MLVFIPLSIGNGIKNCYLTFGENFDFFSPLAPVQKEGASVRGKAQESAKAEVLRGSPQPLPKRDSCWLRRGGKI